ncbi:hypothetical protein [Halopiger djelfimassiliensis]|uniref:hypothetical protein n=1 Tax=Halopiger djelfimassiliensis TaxID=1293047 RepID=UPI00067771FB|nr:hypothetical protein [Halopiger djelfimassiliensis]
MLGLFALILPAIGAYAVYVDGTNRDIAHPIGWAVCTAAIGYLVSPVLMGLYLALYLVLHWLEGVWQSGRPGVGI